MKPTIEPRAVSAMLREVPGPKLSPMRQALAFAGDQYAFLRANQRELGDVFTFRIPGEPVRLIVGAPSEVKKVFALRPEDYFSGDPSMHVNFGESSILFHDGDRHHRDRQLITPPLHGEALRSYGEPMLTATRERTKRLRAGDRFVAHTLFRDVALDVVLDCVLGAREPTHANALREASNAWFDSIFSPWMFTAAALMGVNQTRRRLESMTDRVLVGGSLSRLPFPGKTSIGHKVRLMRLLLDDVERARATPLGDRRDVLAMLAHATYEDGQRAEAKSVVDQLVLLMSAGHETTAKSMCWALADFLVRPEVVARIRDEIGTVFGDGPIDPSRIDELTYLDAAIRESMRLTPVTTLLQREITRDIELGGMPIAKGTVVAPCNYLAHRHPGTWEAPDEFRPERFLDPSKRYGPHEFFPFGGGRRRCLGVAFASYEMPLVIATLLRNFDLRLEPGTDLTPTYGGITIGPKDGVGVRVERVLRGAG